GPVAVPRSLAAAVVAVLGLYDRPQARPRLSRLAAPAAVAAAFTPPEVAALYAYPPGSTGQGQTIGLIELGGGYDPADVTAYFAGLGLPAPALTAVGVDGAANQPTGSPNGADGEVQLDIEVAGAVAPGAAVAVYFAPNTDAGFMDAVTTAIHDRQRAPAVLSISWGSAESTWSSSALTAFDRALADAALLGVTVCCAAGDQGSGDGVGDGLAHVDFPAASPHVLGCGGTSLTAAGGAIAREVVWNAGGGATGGGVSAVFPLPAWQAAAGVPPSANPGGHRGRGVPDVAGDADPATGYRVQVDGQALVFGGTSAVAPLWAGLVARLNAALGHAVGYLNPVLYPLAAAHPVTRDITEGSNGAYRAAVGWDPCTGLGSPLGERMLAALAPSPTRPAR
ncbi:MAG TPA: S53 family peptidase, partial [Candidatus Dormibacteraeota bacterium]|nr:S53 family peptidase [Candidatus Dormibacteraeota bacterium]